MVRVPYRGAGPALNNLIGGEVQLMFPSTPAVTPFLPSGRLRALAVTSARSSVLMPGLPTVGQWVPGYESVSTIGLFAPARTPATLVDRINREIVRAFNRTEVKEKFLKSGGEVIGSSPEEFTAAMQTELSRMTKLINASGMRAE
jgi:tripartite-type tricarboxylate transporter receptor subunit TctC